jgi:hypothetical protein
LHRSASLVRPRACSWALDGHGTGDRRPMHAPALRQRVVLHCEML